MVRLAEERANVKAESVREEHGKMRQRLGLQTTSKYVSMLN